MRQVLLDTHALLWHAQQSPQLSATALAIINDGATRCFVSRASLWEIVIKQGLGKLNPPVQFNELVKRLPRWGFDLLEITDAHLTSYLDLPLLPDHRDPFDRLLVAQARAEGLEIVSRDPNLARYDVPVRW